MKLLSLALLMSAAFAAVAQGDAGFPEPEDLVAADLTQELPTASLRRFLADNSTTAPPTTAPTTAPPTSRPPTSAPPTSSPSPSPTSSPAPTSATPNSPTPTSTGPATPTPAPSPSTPSPNGSNTPTPTKTPANNNNNNNNNESKNTDPATVAPNASSGSKAGTNSTSKSSKTPAPSSSSGTNTEGDDSKMSGGTIAAIVGGIVAGVAILACVTMVLIRRKRETDDDPLSPFEMSMDKGYAGAHAGYGNNNNNNNAPGYAGAATSGAQRNAPGRTQQQMDSTDTPPAGAIAAGVAYSQFYDQQTSPGSINHTRQLSGDHESTAAPVSEATNLWMSAMEAGTNENDSYLSAKEGHDNESIHSSTRSNRNSYDLGYNDDQSSQISGASDLNSAKDFPDYEDESARGSYEL